MDDVRLVIDVQQRFQHRFGEKGKALGLIKVAVDAALPLKILLVIQKVILHPAVLQGKDAAVRHPPGKRHPKAGEEGHAGPPLQPDAAVQRQNNAALGALLLQGCRQGTGDIRQPAGSGKGAALAARK